MRHKLLTPGPVEVHPSVLREASLRVISHRGPEFRGVMEDVVQGLSYLFDVDGGVALLAGSGTTAVDAMVWSCVRRGSRVLVVANGEFGHRAADSARAKGANVHVLEFGWGDRVDAERVLLEVERLKPDAVIIVHNETSTGVINREDEALGRKLCGVTEVLVDAVSSLAGAELSVREWCLTAAASASHKAIGALPGVSFVAVSRDKLGSLDESVPPSINVGLHVSRYAEKGDTPFTPSITLVLSLRRALEMIREEGLASRIRAQAERAKAFYGEIEREGLSTLPSDASIRSPTVAAVLLPEGVSSRHVAGYLYERGYVVSGGMGFLADSVVRVGMMGNVSKEDLMRAARLISEAARRASPQTFS